MTPIIMAAVAALESEYVITTGGYVIGALVTAYSVIQVALIQSGRKWAKQAAERPVAPADPEQQKAVLEVLGRLERSVDGLQRSVGGVRSDVRATNRRVDHLAIRFDNHIDKD